MNIEDAIMTFLVGMTKASILVTTKHLHHLTQKFILLQDRFVFV